jgi:hypothetical protein
MRLRLVALIICAWPPCSSFAQTPSTSCAVHIAQPKTGDSVPSAANVVGTAQIPAGTKLWVLAHRKGLALWWPEGGGSADIGGVNWTVFTYFGEPRDVGADFEVTARAFDGKQNAMLEAWVKKAADTGQYPGIPMPPYVAACGAEIVTVRKTS